MNIALLTIGDELLNGDLADTNTAAIAGLLGDAGLGLRRSLTVGDNDADIADALTSLAQSHDAVIVTGGLGPTVDDLTARAAAKAFGRPLVLNEEALRQIRAHFRQRDRAMHPRNEKQALLPNKVGILPNPQGTAPGFHLQHAESSADVFFLPGVPSEALRMAEDSVLPCLFARGAEPAESSTRRLTVFGLPEPEVEDRLIRAGLPKAVRLGFTVELPFVQVSLRCSGKDCETILDQAELAARQILNEHLAATGRDSLDGNVAKAFITTDLTLGLAESCTGGLVSKLLTEHPGASAFLKGGAVTYADSTKEAWLGVPADLIKTHGAVSEACALAMAAGIRSSADVDIGLSITGIAGPDGGTAEKPVGTVCIALCAPGCQRVKTFHFPGTRSQVRLRSAYTALFWLFELLTTQPAEED